TGERRADGAVTDVLGGEARTCGGRLGRERQRAALRRDAVVLEIADRALRLELLVAIAFGLRLRLLRADALGFGARLLCRERGGARVELHEHLPDGNLCATLHERLGDAPGCVRGEIGLAEAAEASRQAERGRDLDLRRRRRVDRDRRLRRGRVELRLR